jgi:hypothetical protein
MKWIFISGDHLRFDYSDEKAIATFEQKREFSGGEGDMVLMLEKKNDWTFTSLYSISSIEITIPEAEKMQTSITLTLIKHFKEDKLLKNYIYSLRRISNYKNPIANFRRKYRKIEEMEFEAVAEDKIYYERTLLGTVLNGMHADHQKAFIRHLAFNAPGMLVGNTDIDKALQLLREYLSYSVMKPAEYLKESALIFSKIFPKHELDTVGFADDIEELNPEKIHMIKPQIDHINQYLALVQEYYEGFPPSIRRRLDPEKKFKRLFKKEPLPITLKNMNR